MNTKKLLLTNLIYGKDPYLEIFLNHHLKSFLDKNNVPRFKDRIAQYAIYTDIETKPLLDRHPRIQELLKHVDVEIGVFRWPPNASDNDKFVGRYAALVNMFRMSVEKAVALDAICSPMVADLVVANDYIEKLISRFDAGFGSVFVLPMRTAYEAMAPILDRFTGAMEAQQLGNLGYENLHPLWTHCHWDNPLFTKQPFSLVWNNGRGLLVHSFSITPIAFIPKIEMVKTEQVIDAEVPSLCDSPFWATDWTDCPIMGVEPIQCYYPPYTNEFLEYDRSSADTRKIDMITSWSSCLHKTQIPYLRRTLFYPNFKTVKASSDPGHDVTEKIIEKIEAEQKVEAVENVAAV